MSDELTQAARDGAGMVSLTLESTKLAAPDTKSGVVTLISAILEKPTVQRIQIDRTSIVVDWYSAPGDSLIPPHVTTVNDVILHVPMEEKYEEGSLANRLLMVSSEILENQLVLTHIACSNRSDVVKALGIPSPLMLPKVLGPEGAFVPSIFGIPLLVCDECPQGWLLAFGGTSENLASVGRVIKMNINGNTP